MWNNSGPINISIRLLHMPKACPYKLMDAISVYRNQMQRTAGLTLLISVFLVDSQQIIQKKIGCDASWVATD